VLDVSKIEAGKLVLDPRPCGVQAIIAEVSSTMRARALQRGITLSVQYPGPLPEAILADDARLRQALTNLVANAVKFTEAGSVRIVTRLVQPWRDGQAGLRIDVIDTGIGIAPDRLAQLGQPFVQADASTSRTYGGTGLGLVITRKLVGLMGGQLAIQSTPGRGSTFSITIPTGPLAGVGMLLDPQEAARISVPTQESPPADALAGLQVLVAEDGAANQLLIHTLLRKAGAFVAVASDGREAVEKARAGTFDVILMDMQMPQLDGYQATAALRAEGYTRPIIALTAHALAGDRDKCLAAGCTDYLTKPIDRATMIRLVARHAGRPAVEPSSAAPAPAAPTRPAPQPCQQDQAVLSLFAADAELADVLDGFVAGLSNRARVMRDALAAGQHGELQRAAHQMKGAGGSFGFPELTRLGGDLELAAKAGDIEAAGLALARLAELCAQIVQGHRPLAASQSKAGPLVMRGR
jgi:CheY-like chemotaxis protein